MSLIDRLFGRRSAPVEPDPVQPAVSPVATGPDLPSGGAPSSLSDEPAESDPFAAPGAVLEPRDATPDAPPLKALYGYQKDPAFKNFVDKLKRPPGTERRARMPNLDYPPPASSGGSRPVSGLASSITPPAAPAPTPHTKPER